MPTYRLIHREASTGDRTSALSHLGFRVWLQYQLSADDFGVCPAEAVKLQGDNPTLGLEPPKRIQREIEGLINCGLCGCFIDGRRRYLYQRDWQDWQKIEYPTATSLPPVPEAVLEELSPKTCQLFVEKHPKRLQVFATHARGRLASQLAINANANALEGGAGETVARRDRHAEHITGFCEWVCLPRVFVHERLQMAGGASIDDVIDWAHATRERFGDEPVDNRRPFDFWRARWSEATADVVPTPAEREAWALYTRSLGKLPIAEFVLHRRRGPGSGPMAPLLASFITRKDQPA